MQMYADGPQPGEFQELVEDFEVAGFTTNPTLLRHSSPPENPYEDEPQHSYRALARWQAFLAAEAGKPISIEVIGPSEKEMFEQAKWLKALGVHVCVKIPCVNGTGRPTGDLIRRLTREGVWMNVTGITHGLQLGSTVDALLNSNGGTNRKHIVSVFAGRIADGGYDPIEFMTAAREYLDSWNVGKYTPYLLWASCREAYNIYQAESCGADIITAPPDLIRKWHKAKSLPPLIAGTDAIRQFERDSATWTW